MICMYVGGNLKPFEKQLYLPFEVENLRFSKQTYRLYAFRKT